MKGLFITFEGCDGSGKTTQATELCARLKNSIYAYEPGNNSIGGTLRKILLENKNLSKAAELFLFSADRAQHYKEVLKPNLKKGVHVVCDRYLDSTIVYQGYEKGWSLPFIYRIHNATTGMLLPDITFVLTKNDNPVEYCNDNYEKQGNAFMERVDKNYQFLAKTHSRYFVVNTLGRTKEDIASEIYVEVEKCLKS